MTKLVKNQLLYQLNFLKSIGFNYHESISISNNEFDNSTLPNDLFEFKRFVENCSICELSKSKKNIIFGEGNPNAKIMFIADEPTATEDELKSFFVGKTGEQLSKMIENVLPLKKEDVYITTLVKCRSFDGFSSSHFNSCSSYLYKQIDIINPKLIVTLGEKSYQYLCSDFNTPFSQIRGHIVKFKNYDVIPIHSASYIIRNPSSKKDAYQDMLKIKLILESN